MMGVALGTRKARIVGLDATVLSCKTRRIYVSLETGGHLWGTWGGARLGVLLPQPGLQLRLV